VSESYWVKYNELYSYWEISPNLKDSVFSFLRENFPLEVEFHRWIELPGFAEERCIEGFQETSSGILVSKSFDEDWGIGRYAEQEQSEYAVIPGTDSSWQGRAVALEPPVSPSNAIRIYFNKDTNSIRYSQNGNAWADLTAKPLLVSFGSKGGGVISTGVHGYIEIPVRLKIMGWSLVADASGSIVIDVWKDTWANFPPVVADTIAGSEKPTLSTQQKNQDLTLTTWTQQINAGDVLGFNVDSATTVQLVVLTLRCFMN